MTKVKWGTNTQEVTIPDGVWSVADNGDYDYDGLRSKSHPF
jgi:hypothetical protein